MKRTEKEANNDKKACLGQQVTSFINGSLNMSSESTSGKIDGEEFDPRQEYVNVLVLSSEVPMMTLRTAEAQV